ncbi:MAG: RluA family pseudouridine synthase [Candidatus Buchananbacteria bacterium CG10_big_fil_rev_8_21_14_0_10_42_9]|uniref:Pseudouridine synthase n=1 Tax=Candidatus Buchananbacteria bacterium CG10_big_fil_rev_8_21_14_0_10_42_9 TaxID=1974526 RepID=A0A2H0W0Y0_9BACT|nr:MAG: RluA family pseudouridine synthase [Candidatus Buchananbacteria bacterium CG10_big_fil_rev_8_21_14_0_10_42_9]
MRQPITITETDAHKRLDKFLAGKSKSTRSQIQKQIKSGSVLVDNQIKSPHYELKPGEIVSFVSMPKTQAPAEPLGKIKPFKIIAETNDYLVINKPAGLLVHETAKGEKKTLVNRLLKKFPGLAAVGEEHYRAGIIHRLDKNVSGVMVIPKTQKMYEHLKEQFRERKVTKIYTALVHGRLSEPEGTIDIPIGRSTVGFKMAAHPRNHGRRFQRTDKTAITKYETQKEFLHFTLLKITIKTGRTNQIRVHLTALGNSIAGDTTYAIKKYHNQAAKHPLDRLFLHATTLGFKDLNNEYKEFTAKLPTELKTFLHGLKKAN